MTKLSHSALWNLGFRPFFLAAAIFSVLSMGLWLAYFFGALSPLGALSPISWHSHEMVFGFASAVIAGFVLTAIQNWSGIRGVHGAKLQTLVALWCVARILLAAPAQFDVLAAVCDLIFYPLLAIFLIPYLRSPDLKIERVFFAYFALFFAGNLLVHLESLGLVTGYSRNGVLLGLNTVVLVIVFIGGRVIPFFTESSIARAQPRVWRSIEHLSHISAWGFLVTQFLWETSLLSTGVALAAAVIHLIRLYGWHVRRVTRVPILWILHLAYLWIVIGFALSGLASLGFITPSLAVHAFTVGAVGSVIYGMISRVSLGHTGRRLIPSTSVVAGYASLSIAAAIRVFMPLSNPAWHGTAVLVSGLLWIAAFTIFVAVYWPILSSPRLDGQEG